MQGGIDGVWTKRDSAKEYMEWINALRKKARSLSLENGNIKSGCGALVGNNGYEARGCPDCHEIVMVARSERIISKQNGSNRLICKTLKGGIE